MLTETEDKEVDEDDGGCATVFNYYYELGTTLNPAKRKVIAVEEIFKNVFFFLPPK